MQRVAETSPSSLARTAGIFYLLTFLTGFVVLFINSKTIASGDAAATANKILANRSLFQLGFAADAVVNICYIAVTALFYVLFRPVSRTISLLAAFFSLVGCAVGSLSCLFDLAPLAVLGGAPYLAVFTPDQLQALSFLLLKLHGQVQNVSLVFFGCYCLLIGYLIFRSIFLPRVLGVLMMIAGLGWLTFLSPALATALSPFILLPGIIGEGALTIWLLVKAVNPQRWNEQAGAAGTPA